MVFVTALPIHTFISGFIKHHLSESSVKQKLLRDCVMASNMSLVFMLWKHGRHGRHHHTDPFRISISFTTRMIAIPLCASGFRASGVFYGPIKVSLLADSDGLQMKIIRIRHRVYDKYRWNTIANIVKHTKIICLKTCFKRDQLILTLDRNQWTVDIFRLTSPDQLLKDTAC